MTVLDLLEWLKDKPLNMQILEDRYSDVSEMTLSDWSVIKVIPRVTGERGWMEKVTKWNIPTMSVADQAKIVEAVHFKGN